MDRRFYKDTEWRRKVRKIGILLIPLMLTVVIICFFVLPTEVYAAGENNLTFKLNDDGESYAVTDCNSSARSDLSIPETYSDKPVTSIGDYAFSGCYNLTSITIPDSITFIGEGAFYGCKSITSITIPNGVAQISRKTFEGCSNLTRVIIPDSVTDIGWYAFYECDKLCSITIPDRVTDIGGYAFYGCDNLANITIPDSVICIDEYAFFGCGDLRSVTFGQCITTIGKLAFWCCYDLTSITIPASVKQIYGYAFGYCGIKEIFLTVVNHPYPKMHFAKQLLQSTIMIQNGQKLQLLTMEAILYGSTEMILITENIIIVNGCVLTMLHTNTPVRSA